MRRLSEDVSDVLSAEPPRAKKEHTLLFASLKLNTPELFSPISFWTMSQT